MIVIAQFCEYKKILIYILQTGELYEICRLYPKKGFRMETRQLEEDAEITWSSFYNLKMVL